MYILTADKEASEALKPGRGTGVALGRDGGNPETVSGTDLYDCSGCSSIPPRDKTCRGSRRRKTARGYRLGGHWPTGGRPTEHGESGASGCSGCKPRWISGSFMTTSGRSPERSGKRSRTRSIWASCFRCSRSRPTTSCFRLEGGECEETEERLRTFMANKVP